MLYSQSVLSESLLVDTSVTEDEDTEATYQLKSNKSDDEGKHLKCACPVIADSLPLLLVIVVPFGPCHHSTYAYFFTGYNFLYVTDLHIFLMTMILYWQTVTIASLHSLNLNLEISCF